MSGFPWALAAFVFLHIGVSASGVRGALVRRLGEGPYRGLFALASAAALAWMIWAFARMRADPLDPLHELLWRPPAWGRHATQAFTLLAFLLAVPGLLTPGPTLAGFDRKLGEATGILRVTRHPFLWGVALWAAGHLLSNGERYSIMLFGALGLMALLGTRSIDRKGAARARAGGDPQPWSAFLSMTSNIPFAAIVQGRNKLVFQEIWWKCAVALLVYAAFAYAHRWLVGAPAVP